MTREERGSGVDGRLKGIAMGAGTFADLGDTAFGTALWEHLIRREQVIRMETAMFLDRAPVEALGPGLVQRFGWSIAEDRAKRFVGHLVKQIMLALGHRIVPVKARVTRPGLFTTGARFAPRGTPPGRIRPAYETRGAWLSDQPLDPFEHWLDDTVRGRDGAPDPVRMTSLARDYGVEAPAASADPHRARLILGAALRPIVPRAVWEKG